MAYRRLRLPCLKLTQRSTTGPCGLQDVHRGAITSSSSLSTVCEGDRDDEVQESQPQSEPYDSTTVDEPTLHEIECRSSVSAWERLRGRMLTAFSECSALPVDQLCFQCPSPATVRCLECGPLVFYCFDCHCKAHRQCNIFHMAEKWEDDHFVPYAINDRQIDMRPVHVCNTTRNVPLQCIDDHGVEHGILFACCDCEPIAVTLTRARLWPATPQYPRFAFSFDLLDWAEALLLECQVALRDFCSALYFKCPHLVSKRRDIYSSMIDSFEEYRFFKHETRHLGFLSKDLDSGNVCPACPTTNRGKVVYAMDALFGLPRKKSAGVSYREALHGNLFFCDQVALDQFVSGAPKPKAQAKDCSDFVAGDTIRSASRYKALDETAIFGSACRHEFPAVFMNLKHGERLAYSIWMLDELLKRHHDSDATEVFVMYDVACTLHKHLQANEGSDILSKLQLCLPTFHSYGHSASCQMVYSPRRCEGIGLSDGETMERLWSFLRRFSRMTKEMRPAHRIDILAHALIYYGMRTKQKLAQLLTARFQKAQLTKAVAEKAYQELTTNIPGISEDVVKDWLSEEKKLASHVNKPLSRDWQTIYVQTLQQHDLLRENFASGDTSQGEPGIHRELLRLNERLQDLERKHNVHTRWQQQDDEYVKYKHTITVEKQQQLGDSLWRGSVKRQFLLRVKAKYADGHKIAKKLSLQISKETRKIKMLLQEYELCQSTLGITDNPLDLLQALDPSKLTARLSMSPSSTSSTAIIGLRREIVDAYLLVQRSKEEIDLLEQDMKNTICYHSARKTHISQLIQQLCHDDSFNRGAKAMLHALLFRVSLQLEECQRYFSNPGIVVVPDEVFSDTDSDSDDGIV